MNQSIKAILLGSVVALALGLAGYLSTIGWLIGAAGVNDSGEIVDIIRSKQAMYYSMPYTLLSILLACWFAVRKLEKHRIAVIIVIALVTCFSITAGPLKLVSIHMNYLPIVIGGLIAFFVTKKT